MAKPESGVGPSEPDEPDYERVTRGDNVRDEAARAAQSPVPEPREESSYEQVTRGENTRDAATRAAHPDDDGETDEP
jgi:hypothetical protein